MRRYRVLGFDFDGRVSLLTTVIEDDWEEDNKELWRKNKKQIENELILLYGEIGRVSKLQNFIELGNKPFSILAFHNKFLEQARTAFVMGAYYPALTAACALGERILNHMVLRLRKYYKQSKEYKDVYRKDSIDNWDLLINTLESWNILLPEVAREFRVLKKIRHSALHFRPELDYNDRELALKAIQSLFRIASGQFSGHGLQPWFIENTLGEAYIKKDWTEQPFVKEILLPNCVLLGPEHRVLEVIPQLKIYDNPKYENQSITDEKFIQLRDKFLGRPR
jgi:hypothetical protein